jgi:ABC-type molybdate transport system substrate-binding protein
MIRSIAVAGLLLLMGGIMSSPTKADDRPPVRLLAAGSLQGALTDISNEFSAAEKIPVATNFGPSGMLRDRIEKGEKADLFASADMGNPLALSRAGKAGPVVLFARNRLCAMVRPGLDVTPDTLLAVMLNPTVKLGTSTPKSDTSGDYTWAMFAKADAIRPGNRAALEAKAVKLMGGPNSPQPPQGENLLAWHLREKHADIFISYCSAGPAFTAHMPGGKLVSLPPPLATGADYGLTVLAGANANAARLALFLLSQGGQRILAKAGFDAPLLAADQP